MKKRSGILAIMVSLSIAAPIKAGFGEMFSTVMNSVSYTFVAASISHVVSSHWGTALNAWIGYRNGVKIDGVNSNVNQLHEKLATTNTVLKNVDKNVTILTAQMDNQGKMLDNVDGTVSQVLGTVQDHNRRFDNVDKNIQTLADENRSGLNQLNSTTQDTNKNVQKANDQLTIIKGVVVSTADMVASAADNMEALKNQHVKDIANLNNNLLGLKNEFGEFRDEVRNGLSEQRDQFTVLEALLNTVVTNTGGSGVAVHNMLKNTRERNPNNNNISQNQEFSTAIHNNRDHQFENDFVDCKDLIPAFQKSVKNEETE